MVSGRWEINTATKIVPLNCLEKVSILCEREGGAPWVENMELRIQRIKGKNLQDRVLERDTQERCQKPDECPWRSQQSANKHTHMRKLSLDGKNNVFQIIIE